MSSFGSQLLSLTPWLLGLFVLAVGRTLLRFIARRSIYIYGHRIPRSNDPRPPTEGANSTMYRFAIQNAESTPIEVPLCARVSIVGEQGRFTDDPCIYAGPHLIFGRGDSAGRVFEAEFDSFPAYDTWVWKCPVQEPVSGVRFELWERGLGDAHRLRSVPESQVVITPGNPLDKAGRDRTPALPLVLLSWVLGLGVYAIVLLAILRHYDYIYTRSHLFTDFGASALLLLVAWLGLGLSRRRGPSAIQGYLLPTDVKKPEDRTATSGLVS